jgi:hypothetical protein
LDKKDPSGELNNFAAVTVPFSSRVLLFGKKKMIDKIF